jgi:hypothetical protein
MKITVCIPLYNGVEFLTDTLVSVKEQTYTDFVCIIGVNGHGQNGGDVLPRVKSILDSLNDKRFQVVNLPNVNGISEADNALLELAQTEWVAHLDADDTWHIQKLEVQTMIVKQLNERGIDVDLVGTSCQYFGTLNHVPQLPHGLLSEASFKNTNPIVHSSILVKKSKISYPSEEGGVVPQDYAAYLNMIGKGSYIYNSEHVLTFHRIYQQSHFNASGKQNPTLVADRFFGKNTIELQTTQSKTQPQEPPPTVVTAFYDMPSKFPKETYINWIRNFFENVPCNLVVFLEEQNRLLVEQMRSKYADRTKIIILPRANWTANTHWPQQMWEEQLAKDTEKNIHSPDLYKIWYEKKEFVLRAIELNPFNSDKYVWCDAGLVRSEETKLWMYNFPRAQRIPEDRMLLLQIDPFTEDDCVLQQDGLYGNFQNKNRIGGGIQAATKSTWKSWAKRYDVMMQNYLTAKRFVGKDQSIMASLILEEPTSALCIKPPKGRYSHPIDCWFFLALWLGATQERYNLLVSVYNF